MALTREELDDMEKTLKEAFKKAKEAFNANRQYSIQDEDLRAALVAVGSTAAALLKVDERLREMDDSPVAKLPAGQKMPGK